MPAPSTDPASPPRAQPAHGGFSTSRLRRLGELFAAEIGREALPGAIVLVQRDAQPVFFDTWGYLHRESQRPMRADAIFRIASMSKPVTAVAALQLVEAGVIALDDPVSRHLPQFEAMTVGLPAPVRPSRPMRIHDLLRHTAGLPYGGAGDTPVHRAYRAADLHDDQQSNADFVDKLARLPLSTQPGSTFEYGLSFDVLGRVIEVAAGVTLGAYIAEHICAPLGMVDTGFALTAEDARRLAEPHAAANLEARPALIPYDASRPAKWQSGGAGLLSTAADYARFLQMLLNGGELGGVRLLSRKSVAWMTANHLPDGLQYGAQTASLSLAAPLPALGQGYGLGVGVRLGTGLASVPGSAGDFYWGGATGPYFWVDPAERLICILMIQERDPERRARYRALLRALVYQALL